MSELGTTWLRRLVAASAAAAVVLGAGCGGDVDIDSGSGEVRIETDEGSLQGSTEELPDGFPEGIPLPDGFEILSSMSTDVGDGEAFSLVGTVNGAASEVFDPLAAQFRTGGWEESDSGTVSMGGTTTKSASFETSDWRVMLIINETEGESTVTYAVSAASN